MQLMGVRYVSQHGLVVILVASLVTQLLACIFCPRWLRFVVAVIVPCSLSIALFWVLNFDHLQEPEAQGWFVVFFIYWSVPSTVACLVVATISLFVSRRSLIRQDGADVP